MYPVRAKCGSTGDSDYTLEETLRAIVYSLLQRQCLYGDMGASSLSTNNSRPSVRVIENLGCLRRSAVECG